MKMFATPFLGMNNVAFNSGVSSWTQDFSHGEMIRTGYDEQLEIDPNNMQFVFQGTSKGNSNYALIPWQLGIATRK